MKSKVVKLLIIFLIIVLIICIGYILIKRHTVIESFRNEAEAYLNSRYIEEMCIDRVSIDIPSGLIAHAHLIENSSIKFKIRVIDEKMVDGFLKACIENEVIQNLTNEVLRDFDVRNCRVVLNDSSLSKENLYDLYCKYNRPAKLNELLEYPDVDYVLVKIENNDDATVEKQTPKIVAKLSEYFDDQYVQISVITQ